MSVATRYFAVKTAGPQTGSQRLQGTYGSANRPETGTLLANASLMQLLRILRRAVELAVREQQRNGKIDREECMCRA